MFVFRAAAKPSSQRMYLTAVETVPNGTVTGWTADAAYPATTISGNGLVIDRAGTITITSNAVVSTNNLGATVTATLYKNGSTQLSQASTTTTGTLNLNVSGIAVAKNDTITMSATTSFDSPQLAATTTFITLVSQ